MAETTYYYRVAATELEGVGMQVTTPTAVPMAMTMAENMAPDVCR